MSKRTNVHVHRWTSNHLSNDIDHWIKRAERLPDVWRIAVMPDVHLSTSAHADSSSCVGTAVATHQMIHPHLLGADLGCGVASQALELSINAEMRRSLGNRVLRALEESVPILHSDHAPDSVLVDPSNLSSPSLRSYWQREGSNQFASIGRGNHFVEIEVDETEELWLTVHTGSRCMGPAIQAHHAKIAKSFDANTEAGQNYLRDVSWARALARQSRARILHNSLRALRELLDIKQELPEAIDRDHDSISLEEHFGCPCYVHRKGAMHLKPNELGLVPGSMGTSSFLVRSKGVPKALDSCAHGAGRELSRSAATARISRERFLSETEGVVFNERKTTQLIAEAPSAYKDVENVMRDQRELVSVVHQLKPWVVHKGS